MATVLESLKGINAYPIPQRTIVNTAEYRGLNLDDDATQEVMRAGNYNLAQADLLMWLSQGGQDYSFTDEQRVQFRNRANALYDQYEEETVKHKPTYGYKGSRL